MYQQQLQNFISEAKSTFYDGIRINATDYHSVNLVRNFADYLLEKFEDIANAEEYVMASNDDEDAKEEDDESESESDEENMCQSALNAYLREKCKKLYGDEHVIQIEPPYEMKYNYTLKMHNDIWRRLFDVIINKIIEHCGKILKSEEMVGCKYIFLVGGFANSMYFQERIKNKFKAIDVVIPGLPQLCVVDGAARYGLHPRFMKIRRLSNTYGIKANRERQKINENTVPHGFLEENSFINKTNKIEYIRNCFLIFVAKNQAININDDPIIKPVYKRNEDQKEARIQLYESDKEQPVTCLDIDARYKGDFVIKFDDYQNVEKICVEFDFSDTMLTVHAYGDGLERNQENKIEIDYA